MKGPSEEFRGRVQRGGAGSPARVGWSRFPGKPLAPLLGRPMIEHVVRRAAMCERLEAVYVATWGEEIRAAVTAVGIEGIMTLPPPPRARAAPPPRRGGRGAVRRRARRHDSRGRADGHAAHDYVGRRAFLRGRVRVVREPRAPHRETGRVLRPQHHQGLIERPWRCYLLLARTHPRRRLR